MEKIKLLLFTFLIILIGSCTDTIIQPVENNLPVKLYPYETIYDAATFKERRENLINNIPNNSFYS